MRLSHIMTWLAIYFLLLLNTSQAQDTAKNDSLTKILCGTSEWKFINSFTIADTSKSEIMVDHLSKSFSRAILRHVNRDSNRWNFDCQGNFHMIYNRDRKGRQRESAGNFQVVDNMLYTTYHPIYVYPEQRKHFSEKTIYKSEYEIIYISQRVLILLYTATSIGVLFTEVFINSAYKESEIDML